MQGVEQFGDYGIQIRLKMMTKPGEQFVIRRKALALIKKAFDENGIRFAVPDRPGRPGREEVGAGRRPPGAQARQAAPARMIGGLSRLPPDRPKPGQSITRNTRDIAANVRKTLTSRDPAAACTHCSK